MATVEVGAGVKIETPPGVRVAPFAQEAAFNLDAAQEGGVLLAALSQAGFTPAATFSLKGVAEEPRGATAGGAAPTVVSVPVRPDESAVILVEGADGVFAWALPQRRIASSSLGVA